MLDTSLIIELSADELEQVEQLKQQAKERIKPDHQRAIKSAKRAYIAQSGKPVKQALRDYQQLQNQELTPDFVLHTVKGERLACTLSAKDDGLTMAEPFDPDYDGGSKTKAKFYWNSGNPIINSQAHGGIKYSLPFLNAHTPRRLNIDYEPLNNGHDRNSKTHEPEWKIELLAHIEKFNKNHAQVLMGGKHRIRAKAV